MIYLGIDTSCYTTSVAAVDENGNIISNRRKMLSVAEGERGLRQSEAFFKHINQFPDVYDQLLEDTGGERPAAVCVSVKPRGNMNSYMPVFLAGTKMAQVIAGSYGIPLYQTDHQQGHLAAAMVGQEIGNKPFVAVHLSGGTTDVLLVRPEKAGCRAELLASSGDINAGQLLDRLGVAMGTPFPAGKHLDRAALDFTGQRLVLPISADAHTCSFSGTEAAALRELQNGREHGALAEALLSAIARTLAKMAGGAAYYAGADTLLMAGGVSTSEYLRRTLPALLEKRGMHFRVLFAQSGLSADNAVGVAQLCRKRAEEKA